MKSLEYHEKRDKVSLPDYRAQMIVFTIKHLPSLISNPPEVRNVLDIGTGKGTFIGACRKAGLNAYGADIRREIYNGEKGRLVQTDADFLPFRDKCFDLIFERLFFDDLTDLQKYSSSDLRPIVKELHRILRDDGIVYSHGSMRLSMYKEFRHLYAYQPDFLYGKSSCRREIIKDKYNMVRNVNGQLEAI